MNDLTHLNNANPAYIDSLYQQYLENPANVDTEWQLFFKGYDLASEHTQQTTIQVSDKEVNVIKLINAYRTRGHLIADTNPIRQRRTHKSDLSLSYFNLSEEDLGTTFSCSKDLGLKKARDLAKKL